MAYLRFCAVILALWGLQFLLMPMAPVLWVLVDPLLLFLIFLGLNLPRPHLLWLYGAFAGFLKDVATSGLFGGYTFTFAAMGWLLEVYRHLVEREDYLIQGVWAGLLTGLGALIYGLVIVLADPVVGWNRWWWGVTPVSMLLSGFCAAWSFPRFRKFLRVKSTW